MNNNRWLLIFMVILLTGSVPKASAQSDVYVSYQEFYDELTPYGQWINDPQYGYIWVPDAGDDFRPYFSSGHWVMTEYGNTWISDYPWGWACFHYGRWVYNDYYGWLWIPGNVWGPGWVVWRWGYGYCGWAPMYPGYEWGIGVTFGCPDDWWIFMHPRYLYRPRYLNTWRSDFIRGPRHTRAIVNNTTIVTNIYSQNNVNYYGGPNTAQVQQVIKQPVQVYHLQNSPTRGNTIVQNNTVNIYRPTVGQTGRDGMKPAPVRVMPAPRPVAQPENVRTNWNQQREFRNNIQQQNHEQGRPYKRNDPPYSPAPPVRQQPNITPRQQSNPSPQIRQPQIRKNPAPPVRQPSPAPARQPQPQQQRKPEQAPGQIGNNK